MIKNDQAFTTRLGRSIFWLRQGASSSSCGSAAQPWIDLRRSAHGTTSLNKEREHRELHRTSTYSQNIRKLHNTSSILYTGWNKPRKTNVESSQQRTSALSSEKLSDSATTLTKKHKWNNRLLAFAKACASFRTKCAPQHVMQELNAPQATQQH